MPGQEQQRPQRREDEPDDAPHLAPKPTEPHGIVVFLLLLARRRLGPHTVNQPERMGRVREIPASQRGVEVRRVHSVDANRVGAHLGYERNPPLIGAVIRRKLRGVLARKRGTKIHGLDPHGRPLTRAVPDFDDAPPCSRPDSRHRRPRARGEHVVRDIVRQSRQICESGRIARDDSQCPLEAASRHDQISSSVRCHSRARDRVVGHRINRDGASEEALRGGKLSLAHRGIPSAG